MEIPEPTLLSLHPGWSDLDPVHKQVNKLHSMKTTAVALLVLGAAILAGCTAPKSDVVVQDPDATGTQTGDYCDQFQSQGQDQIDQDGSSTVYPIAEVWAETFGNCLNLHFVVAFACTGGGFKKFCAGSIDVSDASRPITNAELSDCTRNGINPFEVQVAIDGLAVVVSRQNTFVDYFTVTELNKIWTAVGSKQVSRWSDVRAGWPNQPIDLYGPGTDSGTFDYWREVIIRPFDGSTANPRNDFTPSEDDEILVQGVAQNQHTLGYFGIAYVEHNQDKIRAVPVKPDTLDGGKTTNASAEPVEPTPENVIANKYKPLSRPLFMYTNGKPTGRLLEYFKLGIGPQGQDLVGGVGYIKLPADKLAAMKAKIG